jgi:hypothetical protein
MTSAGAAGRPASAASAAIIPEIILLWRGGGADSQTSPGRSRASYRTVKREVGTTASLMPTR